LKGVNDPEERRQLLEGAFEATGPLVAGKRLLLMDDLYRSGLTMSYVAEALSAAGARAVYAFAITETRTRS
jgi:predicted amidophosphoribosyltransferase